MIRKYVQDTGFIKNKSFESVKRLPVMFKVCCKIKSRIFPADVIPVFFFIRRRVQLVLV